MSEENGLKRFFQFKKKQNDPESASESFDESSFSFELKSNNLNTSLIEASAIMKKGKHIGMPLPLKCTWYRATDEKEFVTIEGVTGAFYQPNADDVGCKICVHAVPVSEIQEYTGMPAFSEVGPIQLDSNLQTGIQEILQKGLGVFNVMVSEKGLQKQASIVLEKSQISVKNIEGSAIFAGNLTETSPQVMINYKSNNGFVLDFTENKLEIVTEKPTDRDLIVIAIRMFCSKSQSADLSQILLKNQQLSIRLFQANQNYEQSLAAISVLKDEALVKAGDLQYYQSHYKDLEKEFIDLKENSVKVLSQNEDLASENGFLRKDLLVYKEQCALFEGKIEIQVAEDGKLKSQLIQVKEDLESLVKVMGCGVCKVDEKLYMIIDKITGNTNRKKSSKASSVVSYQEDVNDIIEKEESECAKHVSEELTEAINKIEAEKNFYKRKAESLSVENEKLLSKLGKNPKDISEFAHEKEKFEESKRLLVKELEDFKQKAQNSEHFLKINKQKLEREMERNFELQRLLQNKGINSNSDFQRIVYCLTGKLSEQEEELASQKSLNKAFMNRIAELEAALSLAKE